MSNLRNIRIATGIKKIELGNENFAMLQIRDVLKEHRDSLISSLVSDLTTYIKYKFSTPVTKEQLEKIRARLYDLKNSSIALSKYSEVIGEVLANESTYVKSEPFYKEINETIGEELNPSQLMLVK
jgi:hypothetical protein